MTDRAVVLAQPESGPSYAGWTWTQAAQQCTLQMAAHAFACQALNMLSLLQLPDECACHNTVLCCAVAGTWTSVNTGTYLGTIGFAYLSFVMFLAFFFGLIIFQSAVNEELGLRECHSRQSCSPDCSNEFALAIHGQHRQQALATCCGRANLTHSLHVIVHPCAGVCAILQQPVLALI